MKESNEKPRLAVKVVSSDRPNEHGRRVTLPDYDPARVTPRTDWDYLSSLLPEGEFAVATRWLD